MGETQTKIAEKDPRVAISALREARKIRFPQKPTPEQIRGVFLENEITQVIGHSLADHNPNGTMVIPGSEWLIGIFDTGTVIDSRIPPYQLILRHQGNEEGESRGALVAYLRSDFSLDEHYGIRSHAPPAEQVRILKQCLGFAARTIDRGEVIEVPKVSYTSRFDRFKAPAQAA